MNFTLLKSGVLNLKSLSSTPFFRSATEQSKRLDDARSCARTIGDLFTPSLQIQRHKFCEYCERLMFSDPTLYGKKSEDLLWRKGYYDVVSTAKKLKKKEFTQDQVLNLETHINSGIGFYHHLLAKLQSEFGLDLRHIDFSIISLPHLKDKSESLEWAKNSIHQCLIYLGDLNRYKLELYPNKEPVLAIRYYLQAIFLKSDHGMPHNQMGTMAMNQSKFLDAVYHYMRCLGCTVSFEGTINNLHSLFEKNLKIFEQLPENSNQVDKNDHLKRFITRFLLLIDIWYFNKKVTKVYSLCHQTYKDLEECLSSIKLTNGSCESPTETTDSSVTDFEQITNDMIFKITIICLLCVSKLQKNNSQHASTAVAFVLAIYSQLVQNVTNHIQESVLNYPLSDSEVKIDVQTNGIIKDLLKKDHKKRATSKLRRKKIQQIESDSEASELEEDSDSVSSDSFSDSETNLAESSDDEVDYIRTEDVNKQGIEDNTLDKVVKKIKHMDINDMLEIITEENSLQSIKVVNDWLMQDTEIIKSCGINTRSLLRQITSMLNLINVNIKSSKMKGINLDVNDVVKSETKIPLSEDIILKGSDILSKSHSNLNWEYLKNRSFNAKEETVVRIVKFLAFGKFLTGIDETGIGFDQRRNLFVCKCDQNEENKAPCKSVEELVSKTCLLFVGLIIIICKLKKIINYSLFLRLQNYYYSYSSNFSSSLILFSFCSFSL